MGDVDSVELGDSEYIERTTTSIQTMQMPSNQNYIADQDLAHDEKEWLLGKDSNAKKDNPLKLIFAFGLIGILIFAGTVKRALYPSPIMPSESCKTEKELTICTTDRGWWGNDTISFKPSQSKGALAMEVTCKGNQGWHIVSKHEEIPQDFANDSAKNWCSNY